MSGGSYNYAFAHIEDLAGEIEMWVESSESLSEEARTLRLAFADLLRRAATAAHDIEWVDSCDYEPGREVAALRAVLVPSPLKEP